MQETDVLVIGGGLAGLTAAWSLDGVQTVVLSNGSGSSPYVHGFNLPLGAEDSPQRFLQDTLKSGYYLNNPDLARALCGDSLRTLELLEQLGVDLDRNEDGYKLLRPLGASVARVACAGNHTGALLMQKMRENLAKRGNVQIENGLCALRLYTRDGAVRGALVYDLHSKRLRCIQAKAVVLATGGFCNIFPFSTNSGDLGGDGTAMAFYAGAPLTDMEFIQFEPCVALYPEPVRGKGMITTLFYEGAVLRDGRDERFMLDESPLGERVDKDVLAHAIYERSRVEPSPHGGVWFDATGVEAQTLNTAYPAYVQRYREVGIDLSREPVEVGCAPHTSLGGVVIDANGATPVEGLFACGEAAGGVHGANRVGGNAGLETLVFGRRAGGAVGAYINRLSGSACSGGGDPEAWARSVAGSGFPGTDRGEPLAALRLRLERILEHDLNVIREKDSLRKGLEGCFELEELAKRLPVPDEEAAFLRLRLENDLCTAKLALSAALERTQSAGCHIRRDSTPDTGRARILLRKDGQEITVKKEYSERGNGT